MSLKNNNRTDIWIRKGQYINFNPNWRLFSLSESLHIYINVTFSSLIEADHLLGWQQQKKPPDYIYGMDAGSIRFIAWNAKHEQTSNIHFQSDVSVAHSFKLFVALLAHLSLGEDVSTA